MADRILVVDDEEPLRDAVGRILSAEGYGVRGAEDGRTALRILEAERFDFILCDLRMPGMGGSNCSARSRRREPRAPSS